MTVSSTFIEHSGNEPKNKPAVKKGDTVRYDRAGNEMDRLVANETGEIAAKEVHRYNDAGQLISTEHLNVDNKLWAREVFRHKEGKQTEKLAYDALNVLRMLTSYRYDPEGRLIEEAYRDPTILRGRTLYSYSGTSPHPIGIRFLAEDGSKAIASFGPCKDAHRLAFAYDNDSRILSKVLYDSKDKEQARYTYSYTPTGLYKQYTVKKPRQSVSYAFDYRFDSYGNWTEETITTKWDFFDPGPVPTISPKKSALDADPRGYQKMIERLRIMKTITTRQIEYYCELPCGE